MSSRALPGAERVRLEEDARRLKNWQRWGPYLAERQWGTVREDYSAGGECWDYFPHDHARSRVYRWGEDGLLGITDRECRMCVGLALWNGHDPILKERLFGLTGPEGNHGEDCKELYYYLDATPTSSYLKALYKYPQAAYPYEQLVRENRARGRHDPELEVEDTGVFDGGRYWDVLAEYAKADDNDVLARFTVHNRGPEPAEIHVLPQVWLRNTWGWGRTGEGYWPEGHITRHGDGMVVDQASLGRFQIAFEGAPKYLFTDNETNMERLWGSPNRSPYVKDGFHRHVIGGDDGAINPAQRGTKAAAWYRLQVPAGSSLTVRMRFFTEAEAPAVCFGEEFERTFERRIAEADEFHRERRDTEMNDAERAAVRQCDASLLWSRQFYYYHVDQWMQGDPAQPPPPASRKHGRNRGWHHLYARDIISMPDKWEYPWFAAWDLAFHCVAMARLDPEFAKKQLMLLCREWYMHPNGALPAYEFAFGDINPPVHAWAAWRVYQLDAARGRPDREFLESMFHKCLLSSTLGS